MKRERAMKKRLLIVTNHSYMFWQFRRELAEALQKEYEVILAMPFVGHEEDFQDMGIQCILISMNRRGVNPFTEAKLLWDYERLLKKKESESYTHLFHKTEYLYRPAQRPKANSVLCQCTGVGNSISKTSLNWACYNFISKSVPKSEIRLF